jgi:hypothetical protein
LFPWLSLHSDSPSHTSRQACPTMKPFSALTRTCIRFRSLPICMLFVVRSLEELT